MVIEQLKHSVTPAGKIQAIGRTMHCGVHKLNYSALTKRELLNSGCSQSLYISIQSVIEQKSNYQAISLFSPAYKILFSICLSRLTPCADDIMGYHQCGF
jgi:hypothetical protein